MGKRKKVGKAAKKAKSGQIGLVEEVHKKNPHTFVFERGHIGRNAKELLRNMRRVMEPYTASKLKARKKNVLKDFVNIAGPLNVSHFLMFSKTEAHINMRVVRMPRGPTLTFHVKSYTLSRDVISSLKRPNMEERQFRHHPLLVMNNMSGEGMELKLMATMFQNMFPSINVNKVKLNEIRRCVLMNYNPENKTLDFRHYNVQAMPVGMSRAVKKLIKARIPNLANYEDVSEFLTRGGDFSESEAELDGPQSEVVLPQMLAGRGNIQAAKSAIRLTEIGPRMNLQLIKIEEGVCSGDVLYHEFIKKTDEEIELLKAMWAEKKHIKQRRQKEQEQNVKKKQAEKEVNKRKSLIGMKRKQAAEEDRDGSDPGHENDSVIKDEDDDIEYFKQEVGEAPEPELFPSQKRKYLRNKSSVPHSKRRRPNSQHENKSGPKIYNKKKNKAKEGSSQDRSHGKVVGQAKRRKNLKARVRGGHKSKKGFKARMA